MTDAEGSPSPRTAELVARLARELVEQGRRRAHREREQGEELQQLRAHVAELAEVERRSRRRVRQLEAQLAAVHRSSTWRAGEALLWLPKRARRLVRQRRAGS